LATSLPLYTTIIINVSNYTIVSNDCFIVNDEMERMYMKWMPNVGYYPRI